MSHLLLREEESRSVRKPGRLLSSCALMAVAAVALYPQSAAAQAFQGTIVNPGSTPVTRTNTSPTSETITVNSPSALVNWQYTPPNGASNYVFLPQGNTATFINNPGNVSDYVVINRILASDNTTPRIDFNGTVLSRIDIGDFITVQGGRLWFYAPGGILVGDTGVFDVGSLLLTANDPIEILDDFGYGTGNYTFTAQNPQAAVVNQGSISALGSDAYVAMIAPRITQAGVVDVAGSAAFVAAEVVDFTINGTLFDINVTTGSDADTPGGATLEHSGTTNTRLDIGYGTLPRQVVMVAVPKNEAVTMLVSGTLGYLQASEAVNSGGRIILSAGYNVAGNTITTAAGDTDATANLGIGTGAFNANTEGRATGGATAQPAPGTAIDFAGSLTLTGASSAELIANSDITIGGDLILSADDLVTGNAGEARVEAGAGSTITILGNATVSADAAIAPQQEPADIGGDAQGGTATILAQGGTISIGGSLDLSATAIGERGQVDGGNARGGTATVEVASGTVTVTGSALVDTHATGAFGFSQSGDGTGGSSVVRTTGTGAVSIGGTLDIYAYGVGGSSIVQLCEILFCPVIATAQAGDGFGGTVLIEAAGGSTTFDDVFADASGYGGNGDSAGFGTGGSAGVRASGATVDIAFTSLFAEGYGGFAQDIAGTTADGTGGTAFIEATGGASMNLEFGAELFAGATGGSGADGGDAVGGTARVSANGGSITTVEGELFVNSSAFGGQDFEGLFAPGSGTGGTSLVEALAGGSIDISDDVTVIADGNTGAIFPTGGAPILFPPECPCVAPPDPFPFASPAGPGQGGTASVVIRGGTLVTPDLLVSAKGVGGPGIEGGSAVGGAGFDGTGGTATVELSSDATQVGSLTIDVRGGGGSGGGGGGGGQGGSGAGGTATLLVGGGEPQVGGIFITAGGYAGPGGQGSNEFGEAFDGGDGGDGAGGTINVGAGPSGILSLDTFEFDARGQGGAGGAGASTVQSGGDGGDGGTGTGGTVEVGTTGGAIAVANPEGIELTAYGFGGVGGAGGDTTDGAGPDGSGGNGGQGNGGEARIEVDGGSVTSPSTTLDSSGFGGAGGAAGTGAGGGVGGAVGNGAAGLSTIDVADGVSAAGNASLGVVSMASSGFDGNGDSTAADFAGRLVVRTDTLVNGLQMASLFASSAGTPSPDGPAFAFRSLEGPVVVDGSVDISVAGLVDFTASGTGGLVAGGPISVFSGTSILLSHVNRAPDVAIVSGADVFLEALGSVTGSADSEIRATAGDVTIFAPTVDIGRVTATNDIRIFAGGSNTIEVLFAEAGANIELVSVGDIIVGFAQAGDDFQATAGGIFTGGTVVATGLGPDNEIGYGALAGEGSNIRIDANGDLRLDNGDAADSIRLLSRQGSILSDVLLNAGLDIDATAAANVDINNATAGGLIDLGARGFVDAASLIAGGSIFASGGGNVTVASADAGDLIAITTGANANLGTLVAASDILVDASSGNISVTSAQAGDDFRSNAGISFAGETVTVTGLGLDDDNDGLGDGSNIVIDSSGDLRLNNGSAPDTIDLASQIGSVLSNGTLQANVLLANAAVDIALNDVFVVSDLILNAAGGGISGNSFNSDGSIDLTALDGITLTGGADAGTFINMLTTGAGSDINVGALVANGEIDIDSGGALDVASAASDNDQVDLVAQDAVTVGTVSAGTSATLESLAGDVTVTSVTANLAGLPSSEIEGFAAIAPGGNINVGTATADNMGLAAGGTITAGPLSADNLIAIFADSDINLGAVTAGGLFYVGATATAISQNVFDSGQSEAQVEAALLAAPRAPSGGDLLIGGAVNVGQILTLVGGDLDFRQINSAGDIDVEAQDSIAGAATGDIVSTGGTVELNAAGDMAIGNVRAAGSIFLTGGGLITALDLTAGTGPLLGGGSSGGGTGSAPGGIAPGFDDFVFPRNDDGATDAVALPFTINYFGTEYGQTFVSNNGYVTFNAGQGTFTPSGLGADYVGQPIIAAFFADVDTTSPASAEMTYGTGMFAGRQAFGATWDGVGYFPSAADKLNNFQIILVDRADTGAGNFDIYYNYTRISWETGSASGGVNGFGGTSAAVGYNGGTGNQPGTFFELPGSRVPGSFLDTGTMPLIQGTNNGVPGQLLFQVRSGQVAPGRSGIGDIRVINLASGNTGNISLGDLAATNIEVQGANDVTIASGTADARIDLFGNGSITSVGMLLAGADIEVEAGGAVALTDATSTNGEIDLEAIGAVTAGTLTSGASTSIESETGITVAAVTANLAGLSSSEIQGFSATTAGNINVGTAIADNIGLGALGSVTAGSLDADNLVGIFADGGISLGTVTAGGLFYVGSPSTAISQNIFDGGLSQAQVDAALLAAPRVPSGGDVLISGAVDAGQVLLLAGGVIDFTMIDSATTVDLDSQNGVSGDVILAGGNVNIEGNAGAVTVGANLNSGGVVDAAGTAVTLNSIGNLSVRTAVATAGNVALGGGGSLAVANADASGNVAANAGGTLSLTGNVVGAQISFSSSDISVAPQARIGTLARTSAIDILANGANVVLGGAAGGTGYRLDNAELASFAAQNIAFIGTTANGIIRVEDAAIRGASAASPNVGQEFAVESAGGIDVVGDLALQNASSGNTLRLTAPGEVFVDAATATVTVTNGTALAGTLTIEGGSITVATQAAADEAAAATSTDARDRRLAQNDGAVNEAGYLQAADIVLAAADHIWVQNSGASILTNDRRGITAGPSTIRLVATGSGPVEIIINGRQEDGAGGFITGRDLIPEVIIEGEASPAFTDRSTINGCLIASSVCTSGGTTDLPTIQDFIGGLFGDGDEENPQGSFARPPLVRLSSLIDLAGFPFAAVVDDPVTGAGNEDFVDPASIPQGETIGDPVTGSGRELDCEDEDRDDPRCEVERRERPNP